MACSRECFVGIGATGNSGCAAGGSGLRSAESRTAGLQQKEDEVSSVETTTPTEIVKSIFERLDKRDSEVLSDFGAEDVVEMWPIVGRLQGLKAVGSHFAAIFAAVPDFHIEIERMAADRETVFAHWHATGTFNGEPFLGIEATGRPIDIRGTDCFTIRDGKVVANFIAYDGMTFAVQAGVLPPHGSPLDHAMAVALNLVTRGRKLVGH
jgi:steroid delta-isomerase-like uncharacterized protein